MLIAVIGLSQREFVKYCERRGFTKLSNRYLKFKDSNGNEYLYCHNYMNVAGRRFDKILDLDQMRIDLIARLNSLYEYYIGYIPENKMRGIKIKCKHCGDIIQSKHRHDFVTCSCGAIAIDGGTDYARITGNKEDWEYVEECLK